MPGGERARLQRVGRQEAALEAGAVRQPHADGRAARRARRRLRRDGGGRRGLARGGRRRRLFRSPRCCLVLRPGEVLDMP